MTYPRSWFITLYISSPWTLKWYGVGYYLLFIYLFDLYVTFLCRITDHTHYTLSVMRNSILQCIRKYQQVSAHCSSLNNSSVTLWLIVTTTVMLLVCRACPTFAVECLVLAAAKFIRETHVYIAVSHPVPKSLSPGQKSLSVCYAHPTWLTMALLLCNLPDHPLKYYSKYIKD